MQPTCKHQKQNWSLVNTKHTFGISHITRRGRGIEVFWSFNSCLDSSVIKTKNSKHMMLWYLSFCWRISTLVVWTAHLLKTELFAIVIHVKVCNAVGGILKCILKRLTIPMANMNLNLRPMCSYWHSDNKPMSIKPSFFAFHFRSQHLFRLGLR